MPVLLGLRGSLMVRRSMLSWFVCLGFASAMQAAACSSNQSTERPPSGTGGAVSGSGGAPASGGAVASGGAAGSGVTGGSNFGTGGLNPGTGGSRGTGGSTEAGPASGDGSAGGAADGGSRGSCSAPGLILCDDFEADPLGQEPSGGPWLTEPCSASGFTLKVDGSQAHSGMRSLVSQGVPYGQCMLHADLGTPTDFWVRSWVLFAQGDANQFAAHEVTAFELTPTPDTDDPGIRVGFRGDSSCIPTGVEVNITGGEEKTGCTGFQLQADRWYCFELHVTTNAGTTADFFIDSVDQSFNIHGTPAQTVVNPQVTAWRYLRLGTRSYSNAYPSSVYVDDIAIGTQRIGCN
jgi:hypothetical protein